MGTDRGTSIGFGGGEAIQVAMPLQEVRDLFSSALPVPDLIDFEDVRTGEVVVVNPLQMKVLQSAALASTTTTPAPVDEEER